MIKKTLLSLVALALAAFGVACAFGYGGRIVGYLRVLAFPKDAALLAYFPQETHAAGFAQVPLASAPQSEQLRKELEDRQEELERLWGIRLAWDLDSVMTCDGLLVARGRFDQERMRAALEKRGFRFEEHEGRWMAIGTDAALALDGAYLVGGPTAANVKAALDRKAHGQGLAADAALIQRVDTIGWRHPLFAAVDVEGLAGGVQAMPLLKSIAGWIDTPRGALGLGARVAPRSPEDARNAASELEKAKQELARKAKLDPEWSEWAPVVEKTSIRVDRDQVEVRTTVPERLLEQLFGGSGARERLVASVLMNPDAVARSWAQPPAPPQAAEVSSDDADDSTSDEAEVASADSDASSNEGDETQADDAQASTDDSQPTATGAQDAAVASTRSASPEPDEIDASPTLLAPRAANPWAPLAWAAGFAVLLRLTVPRRNRPGLFGMLLAPAFAIPAVLATTGLVFLSWFSPPPSWSAWINAASLPLPDWDQILLGASPIAHPLFYSAVLPILLAPFGVRRKGARRALSGLCVGYAGALASATVMGAPSLFLLGASYVAAAWLSINVAISLFIARAMLNAQSA